MASVKPILFSGEMVRAILDGRKTQTRRVIKPQPEHLQVYDFKGKRLYDGEHRLWCWNGHTEDSLRDLSQHSPYGTSGDSLYVRETWAYLHNEDGIPVEPRKVLYAATDDWEGKRLPSIHLPRKYSRISLEVVGVRVERIQDITTIDAQSEGVEWPDFHALWDSINEKRGFGWDKNPWVWAIEFKRLTSSASQ